jgi:sugar/nucleoside kinase (ribokinase family)
VNESEASALVGFEVRTKEDAVKACEALLAPNVGYDVGVIVTLGENGCVLGDRGKVAGEVDRIRHFPAKKINAVDSLVS